MVKMAPNEQDPASGSNMHIVQAKLHPTERTRVGKLYMHKCELYGEGSGLAGPLIVKPKGEDIKLHILKRKIETRYAFVDTCENVQKCK